MALWYILLSVKIIFGGYTMCKRALLLSYIFSAYLFLSVATEAAPPAVRHDTNDTNLVALWHLDETGGTVAVDSKGGDNNGTLQNGVNTYSWGATGQFGAALTMGTANTIADARVAFPLTGMSASAGSVAMWTRLTTQPALLTTSPRYFTGWQGSNTVSGKTVDRVQLYITGYQFDFGYVNYICAGMGDQNKLDYYISPLNVGEWYHLALTWNQTDSSTGSGTYQVYVNGIDMPSGVMAAGYTPGCYKNLKGMAPTSGNGNLFNNQAAAGSAKNEGGAETLDEVGFYNDVLTRAQVCELAGADPNKAWNPTPGNYYTGISINPTLSWSSGAGAATHDIYFGSVPNQFQTNQAGTSWSPAGSLDNGTIYYWRIDERGDSNNLTATGNLWRFTTTAGKAANPSPYNGRYNVIAPVTLAWRSGDTTGTHDIYFGTSSANVSNSDRSGPVYMGNQALASTTYTPNGIMLDKRYYWRIDEVKSYPTLFKGDLWTFTISPVYYADDFQSYTGDDAIRSVWKATGTASDDYIWQVTEGSDKAVKFWYDSATSPYYSGIKRSAATVQGTSRDYTFGGTGGTLRLSYKDDPNTDRIYVKLHSGATSVKKVLPTGLVHEADYWNYSWFNLSDFGSVATNVTAIEVGEGNDTPGLGQGYLYIDDIRVLGMEPCYQPPDGDLNGDCNVDYKDVAILHDDWLATPVNLVKNSGMNQGPWGSIPSNQPDGGSDPCSVNWPKYWYLWNNTTATHDPNYVLKVDTADFTHKTCARIDLDGPTTMWNDGDLRQLMDVYEYNSQELLVSFMHKGDITGQDSTMFEYRPGMDGCSTDDSTGFSPIIKRVQRGGETTCGDCYGALSWDWEPYTHIMTVNHATLDNKGRQSRYLHLAFRLCGKADSSANPPMYLKVDSVVVSKVGDTLPTGDIDLDNEVNFRDFAILADNWLVTYQTFP